MPEELTIRPQPPVIQGSGGGGGKGGGGRQPVEQDDNISSQAFANVTVALSEGEIELVPRVYITASNVNTSTNQITYTGHPFKSLDLVRVYGSNPPGGLAGGTVYHVIRVNANTFALASSQANAQAGTAVDLTSGGGSDTWIAVDVRTRIYLDGTPLLSPSGQTTATVSRYQVAYGTNDQGVIGFNAVENVTSVNVEVRKDFPVTRTISEAGIEEILVILGFQALQRLQDNGDITGAAVSFEIQLSTDGGSFQSQGQFTINAKSSGPFQKMYRIPVSGAGPWSIRVIRLTDDSTSAKLQNAFTLDALNARIYERLRYPNTALLALQFDSKQFARIPEIRFLARGVRIQVPENYNPETRTYSGLWNGRFKVAYSNNPAWILYSILTNKRFGCGLEPSAVSRWDLYRVGQFCDEMVPDGRGGQEPRYSCNVYLQNAGQAWDVVKALSDVFKSMAAYMDGHLTFIEDRDRPITKVFTPANVLASLNSDETEATAALFTYSSPSLKARHTAVAVSWDNPQTLYDPQVEYVADDAAIQRYGYNLLDLRLLGCTSRSQAIRAAKWALVTEAYENEIVKFKVADEALMLRPGEIIGIQDPLKSAASFGGRIVSATTSALTVDRPIPYIAGHTYRVTLPIPTLTNDSAGRATLNGTYSWGADGALTVTLSNGAIAAGDKFRLTSRTGAIPLATYRVVDVSSTGVATLAAPRPSSLSLSAGSGTLSGVVTDERLDPVTVNVTNPGGSSSTIALATALGVAPKAGTPWVLEDVGVAELREYRVIKILQEEEGAYSIEAVLFRRGKLTEIEQSIVVDTLPERINTQYVPSPPAITSASVIFVTSAILRVAWAPPQVNGVNDPNARSYRLQYRQTGDLYWQNATDSFATSTDIALGTISQGITWDVRVSTVSAFGQVSAWSEPVTASVSSSYSTAQAQYSASASGEFDLGDVSGTVTLNFSQYTNVRMRLTGNVLLANPTGETAGQTGTIRFVQDGTGYRSVSLASTWTFGDGAAAVSAGSSYQQAFVIPEVAQAPNAVTLVRYSVTAPDNIVLSEA